MRFDSRREASAERAAVEERAASGGLIRVVLTQARRAFRGALGEWWRWEADSEALKEFGHASGVHLKREALAELAQLLRGGLGDAAEVDELSEEAFEACGRDDLEDSARLVAGVPERVPLSAWLVDEIPWAGLDVLIAQ
jgi:hypothetical protein